VVTPNASNKFTVIKDTLNEDKPLNKRQLYDMVWSQTMHVKPCMAIMGDQRRLEQVVKPSYEIMFGMQSSTGRGCGAS